MIVHLLFQHIHHIVQDAVKPVLCAFGSFPDAVNSGVGQGTHGVDIVQSGLILVVIEAKHGEIRVHQIPGCTSGFGRGKQQLIQILNGILLQSQLQPFHICHSVIQSKLLCLSRNHLLDALPVNNQQAVFILQILHILRAKVENGLVSVDGNETAVLCILIRCVLQGLVDVLQAVHRFAGSRHHIKKIIYNSLLCLLYIVLAIPPGVAQGADLIAGIRIPKRTVIFCLFVQDLLHILILGNYGGGEFLDILQIPGTNSVVDSIFSKHGGVLSSLHHVLIA